MARRRAAWLLASFALVLWVAGCGGDPSKPKLGKVHGKVTYNGKALTAGDVIFTPATGTGGETGQVARGQIESDGSYELTTFNTGDGAVIGQHIVTVQLLDKAAENMGTPKPDGTFDYVLPKSLVPAKYNSVEKSPLRCTVEEGGVTFDIALKD